MVDHNDPAPQLRFAPRGNGIKWSRADQAAAVDRGYFVARHGLNELENLPVCNYGSENRAVIIPLGNSPYLSDADVMDAVERAAFHRDRHAMKLILFVEQQDRHGYSRSWNPAIESLTKTLTWYKQIKARERAIARTLTEQGRVHAAKRWRT